MELSSLSQVYDQRSQTRRGMYLYALNIWHAVGVLYRLSVCKHVMSVFKRCIRGTIWLRREVKCRKSSVFVFFWQTHKLRIFYESEKWLVSMSKYAYVKFFQIKYKTTTKNVIGYIIKAHITAVDDFAKRCKSEAKILYQKIWALSSQALIECVKCICVMDTRVDMLRNARRECSWWCSTQQIDTK